MKLLYGLTPQQMNEVHDEVKHKKIKSDIVFAAEKNFPNEKFTEEEIRIAAGYALCFDFDETDWFKYAKDALQMVIDERPHEEPPKSRLDHVLWKYGLKVGQVFTILKNNRHGLFYFDSVGDLYYYDVADNNFVVSDGTLGMFLVDYEPHDIMITPHIIYERASDQDKPFLAGKF